MIIRQTTTVRKRRRSEHLVGEVESSDDMLRQPPDKNPIQRHRPQTIFKSEKNIKVKQQSPTVFSTRKNVLVKALSKIRGLSCILPRNSLYALFDVQMLVT